MKTAPCAMMAILLIMQGCTHSAVGVRPIDVPYNQLVITEEVRPWPVTMAETTVITIPNGEYTYKPRDNELQHHYPEEPFWTIRHAEMEIEAVFRDDATRICDGNWMAMYRDGIDIQLLGGNGPVHGNGPHDVAIPFVTPHPNPSAMPCMESDMCGGMIHDVEMAQRHVASNNPGFLLK